jgi:hypothetical protein
MHHAGPGDREAGAGPSREVAGGLGRVGGGLLVAHADVGDAKFPGGGRDRLHGKTDDPKHILDALLLEAPGHQGGAVDLAHGVLPCLLS